MLDLSFNLLLQATNLLTDGLYRWLVRQLGFVGEEDDLYVRRPFRILDPGRQLRHGVEVGIQCSEVHWGSCLWDRLTIETLAWYSWCYLEREGLAHSLHFRAQVEEWRSMTSFPYQLVENSHDHNSRCARPKYNVPRRRDETYFTPRWSAAFTSLDEQSSGLCSSQLSVTCGNQLDQRFFNFRQPYSPGLAHPYPYAPRVPTRVEKANKNSGFPRRANVSVLERRIRLEGSPQVAVFR